MSYVTRASRPNPAAILGALGVPGTFAAVLIAGLAVNVVIETPLPNPNVVNYPLPEVVEPDLVEPDRTAPAAPTPAAPDTVITRPDTPFEFELAPSAPVTELPGLDEGIGPVGPVDFGVPEVRPTPMVEPVAAVPRGNPGRWITDDDYRPSWINRGYSGRAGFALEIDARGRVTDCRITRSTGHAALDEATCRLLERRARFEAAKDGSGNAIAGRYSSNVRWQIPE
ncbi:TonB family protein [Qipengyuania nanhaisediminis]|uniref:TonB family protein n=1 Tax=Qipengyuania nanhaisediminis TaxID=604088 RepID=UPI0038B3AFDF